jgi:triacylglycerol lipase
MAWPLNFTRDGSSAAGLPLWREGLAAIEAVLLRASPVYYGLGAPLGDGSAVVLIPGFLVNDLYLTDLWAWLHRVEYRPYFSAIGFNAECPNLLMRRSLNAVIDRARAETGRRVHLIGHSLGGLMALAAGAQRPEDVASVITLGSPIRGKVVHPDVLRIAESVRQAIHERNGDQVLPTCYTAHCTCDFIGALGRRLPPEVMMTAIYTRTDGVVDWQYSITGDPGIDVEVPGTHIGLVFNPSCYAAIARRLAQAQPGLLHGQGPSPAEVA